MTTGAQTIENPRADRDPSSNHRNDRWQGPLLLVLVGGFVAAALLVGSLIPNAFSIPPTPAECARDWNAPENIRSQKAAARAGMDQAFLAGWEAKAEFGYCSIDLAARGTNQRSSFVRWVYGYDGYHESPPPWTQEPFTSFAGRQANARVNPDGTVRLLDE